jgi:hypothetical protein
MGNSSLKLKKSNFISFSLQKKDYFISEPINGEITLTNISQCNISNISKIKITLNLYEGWIASKNERKHSANSDSEKHDIFDRENKIIHIKEIYLDINNIQNINLNSGMINLPFIINTNNFSLPSFEYPKFQVRGFIRYILRGEIIQLNSNENNLEITDEMIHIKTLPLILNSPLSSSSSVHIEKWGLMNKGTINMTCSILKNTFYIKENIPIDINIDNSNGKIDVNEIKVTIHRLVNFSPYIHKAKFNFDKTINKKKFKALIKKGEINDIHCNIEMYDSDICLSSISGEYEPLNNNVDINEYLPTCISSLIKCEYNIKISLYFDSFTNKKSRPRCIIPISIGHFKENIENNNNYLPYQNNPLFSNQKTNIYSLQNSNVCSDENMNIYPNQNEFVNQNNNIYPNQNEFVNQNNNIYPNQNEIINQNINIYPNQNEIINQNNNIYPNQNENTPNQTNNKYNNSNSYMYPYQNYNIYIKQNTNIYPNQNIQMCTNQNIETNPNQNIDINLDKNIQMSNQNLNINPNPNYNIDNYPNPNSNINNTSNIGNINNNNSQISYVQYPQMIEFPKVEKPNLNENQNYNYPTYQSNINNNNENYQSIENVENSNISAAPLINQNKK